MKDWRWWTLLLSLWLGAMVPGRAQSLETPAAEEENQDLPPPTGVRDNADVFQRNPALLAKITGRIRHLRETRGFQLYVVIESVLVKGNVQETATRLQRAWVPRNDGMVLVYEVDSRALGIGQGYEQNFGKENAASGQVPSYEAISILSAALSDLKRSTAPEVFLDVLITKVTDGYEDYFKRKENPVPGTRSVKLAMVIIGGAAILALIGLGTAWLMRRSDRSGGGGKFYYFPETEAVERLGAPYGGGEVSSRRFGTGAGGR